MLSICAVIDKSKQAISVTIENNQVFNTVKVDIEPVKLAGIQASGPGQIQQLIFKTINRDSGIAFKPKVMKILCLQAVDCARKPQKRHG